MNFYSQKIIFLAFSLLTTQSIFANNEWIGVECTYIPSDTSTIKEKIEKTEKVGSESSKTEKTRETERNLYEIKHKFFINESTKYVKDISNAIFENDKIHIKIHSERGAYRIILFRNGYNHSTLFIQSDTNDPSHYTGKCHSISLQNYDIFPTIYPSTNRGF